MAIFMGPDAYVTPSFYTCADRASVVTALAAGDRESDRVVAGLIPAG